MDNFDRREPGVPEAKCELEPIHVGNCPICNAFPVQAIAAAQGAVAYRFVDLRKQKAEAGDWPHQSPITSEMMREMHAHRPIGLNTPMEKWGWEAKFLNNAILSPNGPWCKCCHG